MLPNWFLLSVVRGSFVVCLLQKKVARPCSGLLPHALACILLLPLHPLLLKNGLPKKAFRLTALLFFFYHQNVWWFWCWKYDSTYTILEILYHQKSLLITSQSHSYSLIFSTQSFNTGFPWASFPCLPHSSCSVPKWSHLLPRTDDFKSLSPLKPLSYAPDSNFQLLIWVFSSKPTFSVTK